MYLFETGKKSPSSIIIFVPRNGSIQILDTEEAIKQEFFNLSKSKLGRDVKVSDCYFVYF